MATTQQIKFPQGKILSDIIKIATDYGVDKIVESEHQIAIYYHQAGQSVILTQFIDDLMGLVYPDVNYKTISHPSELLLTFELTGDNNA
jgi:hypothetical protein